MIKQMRPLSSGEFIRAGTVDDLKTHEHGVYVAVYSGREDSLVRMTLDEASELVVLLDKLIELQREKEWRTNKKN